MNPQITSPKEPSIDLVLLFFDKDVSIDGHCGIKRYLSVFAFESHSRTNLSVRSNHQTCRNHLNSERAMFGRARESEVKDIARVHYSNQYHTLPN